MPRRHRKDYPGAWWHVGNRGVDRTDIFRKEEDYRHFMVLLALAAHRGWIEIHAWCLMPNHFHLLIRSPQGEVSKAMQWVQDRYARWFNWKYGLKGHRFESRFWGKLILSFTFRMAVFGYIHGNPRHAGIEEAGTPYRWTSERDYESERGRPWVTRTFGLRLPQSIRDGRAVPAELVERWLEDRSDDRHDLDTLLRASPAQLQDWLIERARSRERARRPRFLVRPKTLEMTLRAGESDAPGASTRVGRRTVGVWPLLWTGLLRTICCVSFREIAHCTGITVSTAEGRARRHLRALLADQPYARRAGLVLHTCLRHDYAAFVRRHPEQSGRK